MKEFFLPAFYRSPVFLLVLSLPFGAVWFCMAEFIDNPTMTKGCRSITTWAQERIVGHLVGLWEINWHGLYPGEDYLYISSFRGSFRDILMLLDDRLPTGGRHLPRPSEGVTIAPLTTLTRLLIDSIFRYLRL